MDGVFDGSDGAFGGVEVGVGCAIAPPKGLIPGIEGDPPVAGFTLVWGVWLGTVEDSDDGVSRILLKSVVFACFV